MNYYRPQAITGGNWGCSEFANKNELSQSINPKELRAKVQRSCTDSSIQHDRVHKKASQRRPNIFVRDSLASYKERSEASFE